MTRRINAGEGSLGQLLKDDKLAKSLTLGDREFESGDRRGSTAATTPRASC